MPVFFTKTLTRDLNSHNKDGQLIIFFSYPVCMSVMLDLSTDLSTYEQEYKESMIWFGCSLNDFNNKGSLPTKSCLSLSQRGADLTPKHILKKNIQL